MTTSVPVAGGVSIDVGRRDGDLLPAEAVSFSMQAAAALAPPSDVAFDDISLPGELRDAAPGRQMEFLAGRFCAMEALRRLDPSRAPIMPGRTERGAPVWPSGVVGSITHTAGYVAAAVARCGDARGLGIDSERIVSVAQARRLSLQVCWASELMQGMEAGLDRAQSFTLAYSAKESIFKCLFPLTGDMFYYHDVRIEHVDLQTGMFRARLIKTLSPEFRAGMPVEGRFEVSGSLVHTGVCLRVS